MKHRIKKIWSLLRQKTFLGALGFALALWLYITLNTEFITYVKLPLIVKLPPTRAIEMALPQHIEVKVKGTGWQIFNLSYFNSTAKCEIDLSNEKIKDSLHILTRADIIKNLQSLVNVDAIDVSPGNLNLSTGNIADYSVVVKPDVKIDPADGYMTVGDVIAKPDLINISGNDKIVRNITEWKTIPYSIEGVREPVLVVVPLVDSLANIITISQNAVKIIADIQKISEITINDIPIEIRGSELPKEHIVTPRRVSITIRGGIDDIIALDYKSITGALSAAEIESDTTGILKPRFELPPNIKVLSSKPSYIKHRVLLQ